jgi:hypothetical protein
VRVIGPFDYFETHVTTIHIYNDGGITYDGRNHLAKWNVHFNHCHNIIRPVHSSHDPRL